MARAAMTIHYHGTPITPNRVLIEEMAGANFFVSYQASAQMRLCHEIGQSVIIDPGEFTVWKQGKPRVDPDAYAAFCGPWLQHATTRALICDIIVGTAEENDELLKLWPHGRDKGIPVYHLHEPVERAVRLTNEYPLVAFGSSAEFSEILSGPWERRMDEIFRAVNLSHPVFTPPIHMLRGMQLLSRAHRWPFYSGDSTDIARNHNRDSNTASKMRARWDAGQCPPRFIDPGEQLEWAA